MKNTLIVFLVIIVALLVFLAFKPKQTPVSTPTTNTTQTHDTVSTTLPTPYISGGGSWPPIITQSATAYSCAPEPFSMGMKKSNTQKTINGKVYCIQTIEEGAAGNDYHTYTYTTAFGSGTKTTKFVLDYVSCDNYPQPQQTQCKTAQANFDVDTIVASLL